MRFLNSLVLRASNPVNRLHLPLAVNLVRRTVCSNSNKWKAFLKLSMKMKKTRKTISSKMIVHRNHHTNSKWNNLNKRKKTTLEVLLDTLENSQANMLMLKFSNYLMLMAVEN